MKSEIKDWADVDWKALRFELNAIAALAGRLGLWTVFGANHRLTEPNKPHNSLYVISDTGVVMDRYDKRMCSHTEVTQWYSPGDHPVVFEVDGFRFGTALCIEVHFPELFDEYERLNVDCVLFSAYASNPMFAIEAQAHAAINNYWFAISTPAQCNSELPAGLIGPDGWFVSKGPANGSPGLCYGILDRYDPRYSEALTKARPWRTKAKAGAIYDERRVDDPSSRERSSIFVA